MTRTDAEPAERAWPAEVPAAAPRSAVITGGARGLGAAAARRLRADGVSVTTLDLTPGADITADVTDMDSLSRIAGELGEVDVLVNSAGIVGPGVPLLETTPAQWREVLEVNVLGTVNAIRAFTPGMVERGWGEWSTSRRWRARTATRTCRSTRPPRRR